MKGFIGRAYLIHAIWVGYQMGAGLPYNEEPTEAQLMSQIDGLKMFDEYPDMTPEQNHENWMHYRLAHGWRYGPVKDEAAKTHPDLVPYADLPEIERRKDEMDLFARRYVTETLGRW